MKIINAPQITPKQYEAIVYEIKELDTGMKYIGKTKLWYTEKSKPTKYFWKDGKVVKDKKGKKKLNPRKRNIKIKKETDWRSYKSSSQVMQDKIEKNPNNYEMKIVEYCKTNWDAKLMEAYIQLDYWINGNWDKLYNQHIGIRGMIK